MKLCWFYGWQSYRLCFGLSSRFCRFPAVVEELAKALVVYRVAGWQPAFGLGLVFGFSETVLFTLNTFDLWQRLLLTVPMHGLTAAVMVRFGKPGLVLAILIHYLFNLKIAS